MSPYCEHPECHTARVAYYREDLYTTGTSHGTHSWKQVQFSFWPFLASVRLCRIHALQRFRMAVGS